MRTTLVVAVGLMAASSFGGDFEPPPSGPEDCVRESLLRPARSVVTRSSALEPRYEASNAFDADTRTLWLSEKSTWAWIAYEFRNGHKATAQHYKITYANGECCEQRAPQNWVFQGSNGSEWTTIDTVTNQTGWYANPIRTFVIDKPGAYSKYRLVITADNYNDPESPITMVSIAGVDILRCAKP